MDPYVVFPHWHGLITAYFFLGGIAGGAYLAAMLAELFGAQTDRRMVRVARYIAFPLVCVCGVLLTVDLNRPERFWHMLVQSQTYRPMLKWWSPISVGSWGLAVFGAFSFASFLGVLAEDRQLGLGRWSNLSARLRRGWLGRLFAVGGAASACLLGAYTGTLVSATNQPIWAQSTWIAPLFLASSASTGVAAILLVARAWLRDVPAEPIDRLEWLDSFAIVVELAMLGMFAFSLGPLAFQAFGRWPGVVIPAVVVPLGLLLPLALRFAPGHRSAPMASFAVLAGGLALRFAILGMPVPLVVGR
jgi:protein NrfD